MVTRIITLALGLFFAWTSLASAQSLAWQNDTLGTTTRHAGVRVAIVDTGFTPSLFNGNTVLRAGTPTDDLNAHGNLMNMALAADDDSAVAPNTQVDAYACGASGGVDLTCALQALQDSVNRHTAIVNMSFTYTGIVPDSVRQTWEQAVADAKSQGTLVFASSGEGTSVGFPGNVQGIVSVQSLDESGTRQAQCQAILQAPGYQTIVLDGNRNYVHGNGSSYSTILVSGVAARLLAEGANVSQIQESLVASLGPSVSLSRARVALGLPTPADENMPQAVSDPVSAFANPMLSSSRATYKKHVLVVKWTAKNATSYQVHIGRKIYRTRSRAFKMFLKKNPKNITLVAVSSHGKVSRRVHVF